MANNIAVTEGNGKTVATEDIGSAQYQKIKVIDGTPASTNAWIVNSDGTANVRVSGSIAASLTPAANQSVSGTIGASIIGQLPAGNAVIGAVAASISGVVNIAGSVAALISGNVPVTVTGSVLTVFAPVSSLVAGVTSTLTTTTQVSVLGTPAGAQRYYITQIMATNAATVGTFVDIYDGGNIVFSGYAAASGGGFATQFNTPLRITNLNTAVGTAIRTQASVITNVTGYTAA